MAGGCWLLDPEHGPSRNGARHHRAPQEAAQQGAGVPGLGRSSWQLKSQIIVIAIYIYLYVCNIYMRVSINGDIPKWMG